MGLPEDSCSGISLEDPLHIRIGLVWKKNQHMFHDAARFLEFTKKYIKSNP